MTTLTQQQLDDLLTPDQVGERIGCSRSKVIKLIEDGQLEAVRLPTATGTRRLYRVAETALTPFLPPEGWSDEDLLTIPAVAKSLSVSIRKVYYLIEDGDLTTIRLPSRVRDAKPFGQRVSRAELSRFKNSLPGAQTA